MKTVDNPFHKGEIEAQRRAGAGDVASQIAGFIRSYLPEQHRAFHTSLPFLIVSAADAQGRPWTTVIEGKDGFVTSPNSKSLVLENSLKPQDPLFEAFNAGTNIGLLGIELATRRRNRLSGYIRKSGQGYSIDVRQTFGNCPQYIRERTWRRVEINASDTSTRSQRLNDAQIKHIQTSDTMFIGTGHGDEDDGPAAGFDASHRGGEPGFVQVIDRNQLRIPDYAGNNFFNTIGNILKNPRVGLLFVDFATGGLLHITGRAEIDWDVSDVKDPGARRMIVVSIDEVVDRPAALSMRWDSEGQPVRALSIAKKVKEAESITSFYLAPVDGRPLPPFQPGQHLPIEVRLPSSRGRARRSYSLSAAPNGQTYRLSIKREHDGLVSRALHDFFERGDVIEARNPSGDFVLPCGDCPVVLASAGVGQTPMLSMLQQIAQENGNRPAWFVHGARNGAEHAMREEVTCVVDAHQHLQKRVFYSKPNRGDQVGVDYDTRGRVSAKALLELNAGPNAHYLLCGPAAFVANIQSDLEANGVPQDQIHFETF